MKIALVHDYIKEYGGAERVLMALHEIYPDAPIYTAFVASGSTCEKMFLDAKAKLIPSFLNFILKYKNFHSPLRFLIPVVWESFDFSDYDLVIFSSSSYIAKSFRIPKHVKVICYCHTPPRYVWGYGISAEWARYPILKIGSEILAHFLRLYDAICAKRVDQFVVNSKNVYQRVLKNYRRESVVIYPPVDVEKIEKIAGEEQGKKTFKKEKYFLVVSRIIGGKGIPLIMEAFNELKKDKKFNDYKLKIAGRSTGLQWEGRRIKSQQSRDIEFLGEVDEVEKAKLLANASAFVAAERDVDFGITPVESMAAGCPVIAFRGGGYLETVLEGVTGVFFDSYDAKSLTHAMKKIINTKFKAVDLKKQAEKFSKENFVNNFKKIANA